MEKSIIKLFVHLEHLIFFYSTKMFLSFLSCHIVIFVVRNIKYIEVSFISVVSYHSDFSCACNATLSTVSLHAFMVRWQEVFVFWPPFKCSLQCIKSKIIFTCSKSLLEQKVLKYIKEALRRYCLQTTC